MKYILTVIWESGEKQTYQYNTYEAAKQGEHGMKMANGKQISWTGINEINEIRRANK